MPNYFEPSVATQKAAFGLQCFWHSEAYLASSPGVLRTKVGYAGGTLENPTYRNLGNHIETIEVDFDPTVIKYEDLVSRFWEAHDPTVKQKKRQYISAIFYYDEKQKAIAESSLQQEQRKISNKIVTEILPIGRFYNAEDYHQKYLLRYEKDLFNSLQLTDEQVITSHIAAKLNAYVAAYGSLEQFNEESKRLGLNERQIELARKVILAKDGKPQGCGI